MRLYSFDDVDGAMKELAELKVEEIQENGQLTLQINNLKEAHKKHMGDSRAKSKVLEKAITSFCQDRKMDFIGKRSKELTYGTVGFRVVKTVSIPRAKDKVEKIVNTLEKLKLDHCVDYEQKLNKEELRELDDAQLAKIGLVKVTKDSFRIQPKIENTHAGE